MKYLKIGWEAHTKPNSSKINIKKENVTLTSNYKRYTLPFQKSEAVSLYDLEPKKKSKFKNKLKSYQDRNVKSTVTPAVVVSLPKIYVDMALTGHYSKISVPKHRIR